MISVPVFDIEFYERKIMRLETDVANLQEELTSTRVRLLESEDRAMAVQQFNLIESHQ